MGRDGGAAGRVVPYDSRDHSSNPIITSSIQRLQVKKKLSCFCHQHSSKKLRNKKTTIRPDTASHR